MQTMARLLASTDIEVIRHSPFGSQTVNVDALDWLVGMQVSVLQLSESLSVCISPIPRYSSLRLERLIRREGSSEFDFLAQEYVGLLGSDQIVNNSGIGTIRSSGTPIEEVAYPRQGAAIEIESGIAFDNDGYVGSCYDG